VCPETEAAGDGRTKYQGTVKRIANRKPNFALNTILAYRFINRGVGNFGEAGCHRLEGITSRNFWATHNGFSTRLLAVVHCETNHPDQPDLI